MKKINEIYVATREDARELAGILTANMYGIKVTHDPMGIVDKKYKVVMFL